MLAEELVILDPGSSLWQTIRPLFTIALSMEQRDDYIWHGWNKEQIDRFLAQLPTPCALLAGVWSGNGEQEREMVHTGIVCQVREGQVQTIQTFESLVGDGIPTLQELEPGADHALALMRRVNSHVAPVAWALFTDKATWDEWIYTPEDNESKAVVDKGALLMKFARQGRCVLMGSQVHHHE